MAIQLFINETTELDLSGNDSINIVYESDLLEFENIVGSYTIPFTLPLSQQNIAALDYLTLDDNANNALREKPCRLVVNGITKDYGTLVAEKTNTAIETQIVVDNGNFYYKTKDKRLKEIDLGGEKTFLEPGYNYFHDEGYDPEIYHFQLAPVWANKYFDGTAFSETETIFINEYNFTFKYFERITAYTKTPYIITPFPCFWYVLQQVFESNGFTVKSNCFKTDPDLYKLVMFNNYNAVEYTIDSLNNFSQKIDTYNLINHIPDWTIHQFILETKKFVNCSFVFKANTVEIILNESKIFKNTKIIDLTEKIDNTFNQKEFSTTYNNIEIGCEIATDDANSSANTIYDQKVRDANAFSNPSDLSTFYNSIPSSLTFFYQFLEQFYTNDLLLNGQNLIVSHQYFASVPEQPFWSKFDELCRVVQGDNSLRWDMIFEPPINKWLETKNYNTLSIKTKITSVYKFNLEKQTPEVNIKGNNWFNRTENKQETIKLLIYHGYNEETETYNLVSSDFYNKDKTNFTDFGDLRLRYVPEWVGNDTPEFGGLNPRREDCLLTTKYWKSFINWKLNQSIVYYKKVELSTIEIKDFDFTAKYKILNQLYYCNQIKVQTFNDGRQECILRLLKS